LPISEPKYDLEDRTARFALNIRKFIRSLILDIPNREDAKQLARSSGSIAANYIEANEAVSKKDFVHRLKISRKESKETILWLKLIEVEKHSEKNRDELIQECTELLKILSAILNKSKSQV